jgi:hypothetical protein
MLEYHAAYYRFPEDDGWYVVSTRCIRVRMEHARRPCRHQEIKPNMVRKICLDVDIEAPGEK